MKKIFLWALTLIVLLVVFSGCGEKDKTYGTDDNLQAPTSTTQNTTDETDGSQENTYDATAGTDTTESPHVHSYTTSVVAPTCTAEGYTTYTCNCGDSYVSDKTASVGHVFGEWHTTKEPTSTSTGVAEKVCVNCNKKETKVLGKTIENHTHSFTSRVTKNATCNQEGETTFSCTCGETYTEAIAKTNHTYKTSVTKPTCANEGYTTYSCSCGDSYDSDIVASVGHDFSEWETTKEPTTTATGVSVRICSNCNTEETKILDKIIENHTHSYRSEVTKVAMCDQEGVNTFSCPCGDTYTESIPKLSPDGTHSYDAGVVTKEPTCSIRGTKTFTCIQCGHTNNEWIPATAAHDYRENQVFITATCTRNGLREIVCRYCREYSRETIPMLGHDFDSGIVTTEAHCLWDGVKTFTCSRCSGTYTESIPKLSHSYDDGIVTRETTCSDGGIIMHTCTICGDTKQYAIQKLAHNYVSGKCTGCGRINNTINP